MTCRAGPTAESSTRDIVVVPWIAKFGPTRCTVRRTSSSTATASPGRFVLMTSDALGGDGYYLGKFELEIPLGSGAKELGLRPSIFMDVGSVFGLKTPVLNQSLYPTGTFLQTRNSSGQLIFTQIDQATTNTDGTCNVTGTSTVTSANNPAPPACLVPVNGIVSNAPIGTTLPPFQEEYYGNSIKPRLSIGAGVNWNSPFGPLRIDFAYPLLKRKGDQTKLFSFNVGTQF